MTRYAVGILADPRRGVWIEPFTNSPCEHRSAMHHPEYYAIPALGLVVIVDDEPRVNARLNRVLDQLMVDNQLHLHGNAVIAARTDGQYAELAPQVIAELVGLALWPPPA
jgi:hypothetical protein